MFNNTSFHNVRLTPAKVFDELESVPLFIGFISTEDGSYGEICFHLGKKHLAIALMEAINNTLAEFGEDIPAQHRNIEPPEEEILF